MLTPGTKIRGECITVKCPVYPVALALNNLSSDFKKEPFRCPGDFCIMMREYPSAECISCKEQRNTLLMTKTDAGLKCAFCQDDVKQAKKEIDKQIQTQEQIEEAEKAKIKTSATKEDEIEIIEENREKINKVFNKLKELTKGTLDKDIHSAERDKDFQFYNPTSVQNGVLTIEKSQMPQMQDSQLYDELHKFFLPIIDQAVKSSCNGCDNQEYAPHHMECMDCTRNQESQSVVKEDRFKMKLSGEV